MIRRLAALMAALFIVPALAGSPPARAAADDKAAELLAKHRAFVGWQFGDGTLHSFRIEGTITDEKGKVTETQLLLWKNIAFNDAFTSAKRGGFTEHKGFTGNVFWSSNVSGFTTPIYGGLAKYLASLTLLRLEGTTALPATFQKNDTADGTPVAVVRVSMHNGDPIDLYINPDTGAYVKATIDPDGSYEKTFHFLKYAEALPGKKIVSSFRIDDDKDVTTYSKIEGNADIADQDLHPPAQTASWTFTNTDPVPFTLTHDRFLVDVSINGVKGRFILDTGADGIILDDAFADRVKAPEVKNSESKWSSVYEEISTHMREVDTLSIGGATLHDVKAYSQNFERHSYRGLDWEGLDGLIGFDFFAGAIVKVDTYASKITVLDPATDVSNTPGIPVVVDLSYGTPAIPMKLNRTMDVNAILDTGNPRIVLFGPDLRKKFHLNIMECGFLERLELGPIVYENQAACEAGFIGNNILLGFDFLKHFDMVFDYPHGMMYFTRNQDQSN